MRASGTRPKARYGHGLALLAPTASHPAAGGSPSPPSAAADPRALVFGGESAAGAVNDLFVLRGLAPPSAASAAAGGGPPKAPQPAWTPLEASGPAPTARKGHAIAGDNAQRTNGAAPTHLTVHSCRLPVRRDFRSHVSGLCERAAQRAHCVVGRDGRSLAPQRPGAA